MLKSVSVRCNISTFEGLAFSGRKIGWGSKSGKLFFLYTSSNLEEETCGVNAHLSCSQS